MSALAPEEWARRYAEGDTPWDLGRAHPELAARLIGGEFDALRALREPPRALVPGCGRGHDALALARAGFAVTALDFIALPAAVGRELEALGGRFVRTDALAFEPDAPFELVFDHTFFCALEPALRPRWGELVRRAVARKGLLAALAFPCDKPLDAGGPPFGMSASDLAAALGATWRTREDAPVARPAQARSWPERWASFERKE